MSRLYDRARRYGFRYENAAKTLGTMVSATLPKCEVLSIKNVAQYWALAHEGHLLKTADLPNLAPPFDCFWMEYDWPYATAIDNPGLANVLNNADESLKRSLTVRNVGVFCSGIDRYTDPAFYEHRFQDLPNAESVRWAILFMPFVESVKGRPLRGPMSQIIIGVRDDGTVATSSDEGDLAAEVLPLVDGNSEGMAQTVANVSAILCSAAFLAITLLHCKNVAMVENQPEDKPSRKHKKRHGFPLTKYKTLEIDSMKEILKREGQIEKVGLDRALHICRGHFKTFGGDKKLFGKHEGTYFWPQHIRGKEKAGRVEKDYSVSAPV